MKLSEAILLGSTVVTPKAGEQFNEGERAGCALGMAVIANGYGYHVGPPMPGVHVEDASRTLGVEIVFGEWIRNMVPRPCDCFPWRSSNRMRVKDIVAHMFDVHVMIFKDWTLDELAKWVATVEPQDIQNEQMDGGQVPHPTDVYRSGEGQEYTCLAHRGVGGLILVDKKRYEEVKAEMEAAL